MRVLINGEAKEIPESASLTDLLNSLELASQRVAIELNKIVIRKKDWESTPISDGDRVEIVHFVGGG